MPSRVRPDRLTQPLGSDDVMCSANAASTGDGVPSESAGTSSRPSSSMNRAPWWPSSPGWNMNNTRPARSSRRALRSRAALDSIAVWVSCPHACMQPSTCDANSRPVSSGIGNASMSPRSRIVGPGFEPSSSATMPLVDSCVVTDSGNPSSDSSTRSRVIGRSLPSSGHSCSVRRSAIVSPSRSSACARTDLIISLSGASVASVIVAW